jgi:hypothetical protein
MYMTLYIKKLMKKSQNMPVWLLKMVLAKYICTFFATGDALRHFNPSPYVFIEMGLDPQCTMCVAIHHYIHELAETTIQEQPLLCKRH